ncbi:MAG: UbiD family decarboxylase [Candidatus Binatia bacterium]
MDGHADLRKFIDQLKGLGELEVIEGADWKLEIGAITEIKGEKEGPALLFDKIKGYPPGFRILSNVFCTHKRSALALGLPLELRGVDLLNAWRKRLQGFTPLSVELVEGGPLFENTMEQDQVDLTAFPAPIWHELDGGRYLGTGCGVITRDPETDRVNIGTYRCMIQGKNKISVKMNKGKHGRLDMEKYHASGKPCPLAVTIGQAASIFLASQLPLPPGIGEYEFAGWLQESPIRVVHGPITGIPLPATAEIVLEGEVPPYKEEDLPKEGPFGEWHGYFAPANVGEVPLMVVKRIYYRNDPIILGVPPLKPPNHYVAIPLGAANLWDQLEKAGVPDVRGVWGFVYGAQPGPFTVIAIKQRYTGHSKQTALAACGARAGAYGGKFLVVVDEDVDITNLPDVIWAMATRCAVREGVDLVKNVWTSPAEPAISPGSRSTKGYTMDRVLIDACRPYQWIEDFPQVNVFSKEYRQVIEKKWNI